MSVSSRFPHAGEFAPFFDEPFVVFLCAGQALFVACGADGAGAQAGAAAGR